MEPIVLMKEEQLHSHLMSVQVLQVQILQAIVREVVLIHQTHQTHLQTPHVRLTAV